MNFIDKAFENNLKGDDFLQAMADVYSEPEVREILDKYPQFAKDVILIIDYDYEIQMEGLDNVIYGHFGEQLSEIMQSIMIMITFGIWYETILTPRYKINFAGSVCCIRNAQSIN